MDRFELLDVPARPESRQIKVALEQLGLPYRVASDGPPQGSVRLRHGDRELAEASLILEVLDACAPAERALFPSDAFDAARVRMWIAFDAAMHKEFEPLYRHFVAGDEHLAAGEIARMHAILSGRLDRVESELRAHAWICGDKYTIADAVLAARFDAFPRFGLDPCATRPMLRQWAARSSAATSRRAVAQ